MQENRLSTIQVVAPTTEQDLTSTTEGEIWVTSTSVLITTEPKDLTTTSDAWYKQTRTLSPITSTNTEISTSSDVKSGNSNYKPYFIPSLQVTADTSITGDDNVSISTESVGSTTEISELTSMIDSTTAEGSHVGTFSVEDDILLSTVAADEPVVTSTTERRSQEIRESDVGLGTSLDISNIREAKDGSKQGGSNTAEKLLEGDSIISENEYGTLTEGHNSEDMYSHGNVSDSNSEDGNKNADDGLQADNNQDFKKLYAVAGSGEEPYLLHKESHHYGSSEAVALNYTSDVTTAETTDTPVADGTGTNPSTLC
jgi:hypothetical protein